MPIEWHEAGTLNNRTLEYLNALLQNLKIENSLETGCGRSTILFSNYSKNHFAFTIDDGTNIDYVKRQKDFKEDSVKFEVGPTQVTLPKSDIPKNLDVVLLDGPHGFPFVALEYYHLYWRIRSGGYLIIDDIQIPTSFHIFQFLKKDAMFKLVKRVDFTAFFQRTDAPVHDPLQDEWWLQNYNMQQKWVNRTPYGLLKFVTPQFIKYYAKKIFR